MPHSSPSSVLDHEVYDRPWALRRETLQALANLTLERKLTDTEVLEKLAALEQRTTTAAFSNDNKIAVLPLYGVITQRPSILSLFFGGTSTEGFARAFRQVMNDPGVSTVVLDISSPGGGVHGVDELAQEISAGREKKRIIAVANSLAASAAYWIATAASELIATPTGEVGSIGVYTAHRDFSEYDRKAGVKTSIVAAGKYKAELDPSRPLSEEARHYTQSVVDDYYEMFVSRVAKNRGVSPARVRLDYGEGRVLPARRALQAGMVDRVATLPQVLASAGLSSGNSRLAARRRELTRLSAPPRRSPAGQMRRIVLEQKRLDLMRLGAT
jgi:signal peptide peptidase SppA